MSKKKSVVPYGFKDIGDWLGKRGKPAVRGGKVEKYAPKPSLKTCKLIQITQGLVLIKLESECRNFSVSAWVPMSESQLLAEKEEAILLDHVKSTAK